MKANYTLSDIANLVGVTEGTIKNWERSGSIPSARRVGGKQKRLWTISQLENIKIVATGLGYEWKGG